MAGRTGSTMKQALSLPEPSVSPEEYCCIGSTRLDRFDRGERRRQAAFFSWHGFVKDVARCCSTIEGPANRVASRSAWRKQTAEASARTIDMRGGGGYQPPSGVRVGLGACLSCLEGTAMAEPEPRLITWAAAHLFPSARLFGIVKGLSSPGCSGGLAIPAFEATLATELRDQISWSLSSGWTENRFLICSGLGTSLQSLLSLPYVSTVASCSLQSVASLDISLPTSIGFWFMFAEVSDQSKNASAQNQIRCIKALYSQKSGLSTRKERY